MYHVYAEDWLKVFPRKQFYVVHHETYSANRTKEMERILHFLGVGEWTIMLVFLQAGELSNLF